MIPNSLVLASVVVPLREPEAVDVDGELQLNGSPEPGAGDPGLTRGDPDRKRPGGALESIDGDTVTVSVKAVPDRRSQGAQLADEIIAALAHVTGEHHVTSPVETDAAGRR